MRKLTRKVIISSLLIIVAGLAFASKGGGGDKKKATNIPFKNNFTPIRTTNGFTLKTGPAYTGSYLLSQERTRNSVSFNTIATYQTGNTIFVIPYKYKVSTSPYLNLSGKTNLQMFDLKIRMHK
ncbi:MAG TPA: hypothetical protein VE035_19225 [Puia sp.]|nr:hypothetical protein [Puia sp.]